MKISLSSSYFYKIWSFLFIDKKSHAVSETVVGRVFQRFYVPYLTEVLIVLSLIIYWYEGLFVKYWTSFPADWLGLLCLIAALLFADKKKIILRKSHLYLLGFFLIVVASGMLAIVYGANPMMIFMGFLLFLQFGIVLLAGAGLRKNITKVAIWLGAPLALIGIFQFVMRIPTSSLWLSPGEDLTRVFAFFGSPNVFGILMAMITLLSLGQFIKEKNYMYLAISLICLFSAGFSFSRSAWLGLAFGMITFLVIYNYKYVIYLPLLALGLLIPQVRNRLFLSASQAYIFDSTLDGRIWALQNGFYIFQKHPLLGTGPGSYGGKLALNYASPTYLEGVQSGYTALYFTDNQYLQILVQSGILGFLSFIGFIVALFSSLVRKYIVKKDIMTLAAVGVFNCFLVSGLFANVLEFGAIAIPMGLILGREMGEND